MFCSNCGKSLEPAARFCPFCGTVRDVVSGFPPPPAGVPLRPTGQLVRPRSGRMIAGVCAGLSEHYGWDLNIVRLVLVAATVFTGIALFLFAYIVAWIIIPDGQYALPYTSAVPPPPVPSSSESTAL